VQMQLQRALSESPDAQGPASANAVAGHRLVEIGTFKLAQRGLYG